jgi:hypothetical protein
MLKTLTTEFSMVDGFEVESASLDSAAAGAAAAPAASVAAPCPNREGATPRSRVARKGRSEPAARREGTLEFTLEG